MNKFIKNKEELFLQKIKDGFFELSDGCIRNAKTKHAYSGHMVSIYDSGQVHTIGKSKLQYMMIHQKMVPHDKIVWKGKLRDCNQRVRQVSVNNCKISRRETLALRKKLSNNIDMELSVEAMNRGISTSCIKRALSGIGKHYGSINGNREHDIIGKVNLNKFRVGSIRCRNSRFTNAEANSMRNDFLNSDKTISEFLKLYPDEKEIVRAILKRESYDFHDDLCKRAEQKYKKMVKNKN